MNCARNKSVLHYRLSSLLNSWEKISRKAERKKLRLACAGEANATSPSLFAKIKRLIEQVAFLSEQERDIISEINEVEKKHKSLRRAGKLKRATAAPDKKGIYLYEEEKEAKRKREKSGIWWMLLLLFLMTRKQRNLIRKTAPSAG